ncbi:MAG: cytochrome c biogenesis protein ResB [Deltaproteobacteria bacterium]|nr:cytochrome c biogenesis protein ResB [Deltaproteobacteria bacterium]
MSNPKNNIWSFFASVKLALFVLFLLATASIIGTVIPQNSPPEIYIKQYGANMARLFQILDISDMYNSWWFTSLLILLALNLTVCTIERLPNVWRLVVLDNLETETDRLAKMRPSRQIITAASPEAAAVKVRASLAEKGWKAKEKALADGLLLFAQKGPWTRLGVYVVHSSILIIFAGAMIGSYFGHKGSVMIPETRGTDTVYAFGTQEPIKLGFTVLCKRFTLSHYANGAPKEFRSDLAILEDGKEVRTKSIVVNDPLSYKGYTFYQSSYQSYEKFLITLTNNQTKATENFLVEPGKEVKWQGENISFGIINREMTETPMKFKYKIWFKDATGTAEPFWIADGDSTAVTRPGAEYSFALKEFFATGLQVTKDPGVWSVYIGCIVMLIGLMVAFFLSHQRIWVYITREEDGTSVLVSGNTNKNKPSFEKNFNAVSQGIDEKLKTLS